ncbi:hypothetical protein KA478_03335 [Patescibacteria group bacterium]|nr:hypothetical protein [Patescibacteria group bacterium]
MAESDVHEGRSKTTHPFTGTNAKYKIFKPIIVTYSDGNCSVQFTLKEGNQIEVQNPYTRTNEYIIVGESLLELMGDAKGDIPLWKTNKKLLDEQRLHVY